MKLIEPNCEVLFNDNTIQSSLDNIELAARTCYASDKKKSDQKLFIKGLYDNHHYRPFEFGTIYFIQDPNRDDNRYNVDPFVLYHIKDSHWTHKVYKDNILYYTTNCRVIIEAIERLIKEDVIVVDDVFSYFWTFIHEIYEYSVHHEQRYTVRWNIARGIADEFRTHTMISSLMQSTRYCKYSSDKFGNEISICTPRWMVGADETMKQQFIWMWADIEKCYNDAIAAGMKAEQARDILPLGLSTVLIQCAYKEDWIQFFDQRLFDKTGKAHPDAKYIAEEAYCKLRKHLIHHTIDRIEDHLNN